MKCAFVRVYDDPYIPQMLGFQFSKITDQYNILFEYFTDHDLAFDNIDLLINEKRNIVFAIVDY